MHVIITCKYETDRIKEPRKSGIIVYAIVTCKYEMDPIKNSREKVMTSFSPLQVYGIFFRRTRTGNSVVQSRIVLNFELIQFIMYVIVTCKYEKDPIKNP